MQEGQVFYPPRREDEDVPVIIDEMVNKNLHVNDVIVDDIYVDIDALYDNIDEFIDNGHSYQQQTI